MKISAIGASVAVIVASVASADVTYTFVNQTWTVYSFNEAFAAGTLTGTLTAVTANATLDASVNETAANALCVYMNPSPLTWFSGLLQVGGLSNLYATHRLFWTNGASSEPGTVVSSTRFLATGIDMAANPTQSIWVGNAKNSNSADSSGTWTGTITLVGVDLAPVPAPGAVALLGLAGAIGGRRRRA